MFNGTLRDYQKEACRACVDELKAKNSALIVLPTGAGKTLVISALVYAIKNKRVLIVSHRKELVDQTAAAIERTCQEKVSVYSAGLNKKELDKRVIIAGVQSIANKSENLNVDCVFIDECHLIPNLKKNSSGQYNKLLSNLRRNNKELKIIGLTATPYRLDGGVIYGNVNNYYFDRTCYICKTGELIKNGFLSPLTSFAPLPSCDLKELNSLPKEKGEFKASAVSNFYRNKERFKVVVSDMIEKTKERKSVIVFCPSLSYLEELKNELPNDSFKAVSSFTTQAERDNIIKEFKEGKVKYLLNVDVLTTGFDAPNVDAVVLLRATLSAGLYVQIVGRGLRRAKGKDDCLILDYGGNVARFGGLDNISSTGRTTHKKKEDLQKICPDCKRVLPFSARMCPCGCDLYENKNYCPACSAIVGKKIFSCPTCGAVLKSVEELEAYNGDIDLISGSSLPLLSTDIKKTLYLIHESRKTSKKLVEIKYITNDGTFQEFLGFESGGFLRARAVSWFKQNFPRVPVPFSNYSALAVIGFKGRAFTPKPIKLFYRDSKPYKKIERVEYEQPKERFYNPTFPPYCGVKFPACKTCGGHDRRFIIGSVHGFEVCSFCGDVLEHYPQEKIKDKEARLKVSFEGQEKLGLFNV